MVNKINKKDIQIEIHSDYFLDRKKKKIEEHPMYIDWWIHWISASSVEIKYSNDNELLFNHPLVYCNFIIKNKKYRIGFDLWDKYPLYALQKNDSEVIRKLTRSFCFSSKKIQREIGFIPKYNFYSTINNTISWYKNYKND